MNTCPNCGATVRPEAKICSNCGQHLTRAAITRPNPQGEPLPAPTATGQSPQLAPTQRLTTPLPAYTRLAPGALLFHDRYEVLACLAETPTRNFYTVKDRQVRLCTACQRTNKPDSKFCEACGASLSDVCYLAIESASPQELANLVSLHKLNLRHAGLVNLHETFTTQPVGNQTRTFVLLDPIAVDQDALGALRGVRLATRTPAPAQQALTWLREVAQTLEYLGSKGVCFDALALTQIVLVGQQIKLEPESLRMFAAAERPRVVGQNIRLLAQLFQAMTAPATLTTALNTALQKALSNDGGYASIQALLAELTNTLAASQRPVGALTLQVGSLTDLGLVREINEDSLVTLTIDQYYNSLNTPTRLYAVADGMGGHAAGEVASQLAIKALTAHLMASSQQPVASAQPVRPDYAQLLKQACLHAAKEVHNAARQLGADMGATLVAALVDLDGGKVYVANIGDSRLYQITRSQLRQVTKDHSMVQLLVDKQQLTPQEARSHPQANLIYRTLGEKPVIEVDIFTETIAAGDYLLLCSDGLSGKVDDAQIQRTVVSQPTPQAACQELVQRAKQAGGDDNITVIIVQVASASTASSV